MPNIHLLDPVVRGNPYPVYAEMRRHHPVCQVEPGGVWAVARYQDVRTVLKLPDPYSSAGFRVQFQPPWLPVKNPIATCLLTLDPPAHTRLRNLTSKAFSGRAIGWLEEVVRRLASARLDALAQVGEVDFMTEMALVVPAQIICTMMGIDVALASDLKRWIADVASVTTEMPEPARYANVCSSMTALNECLERQLAEQRRHPTEGLLTALMNAEIDGQRLCDEEILSFMAVLLAAGMESTAGLLGNATKLLGERPDLWAELSADPGLIPRFVEELLRYDSPVHGDLRMTVSETEIAGVRLPAGAMVLALLASANHDETVFPDPETFDLRRDAQAQIAFGGGPHYCLGAALARLEAKVTLELIVSRFAKLVTLPGPFEWSPSLSVRILKSLPLRVVAG